MWEAPGLLGGAPGSAAGLACAGGATPTAASTVAAAHTAAAARVLTATTAEAFRAGGSGLMLAAAALPTCIWPRSATPAGLSCCVAGAPTSPPPVRLPPAAVPRAVPRPTAGPPLSLSPALLWSEDLSRRVSRTSLSASLSSCASSWGDSWGRGGAKEMLTADATAGSTPSKTNRRAFIWLLMRVPRGRPTARLDDGAGVMVRGCGGAEGGADAWRRGCAAAVLLPGVGVLAGPVCEAAWCRTVPSSG